MTCDKRKDPRRYFAKVLRMDGVVVHWTNNGAGSSLEELAARAERIQAGNGVKIDRIWVLDLESTLCIWKPATLVNSRSATLKVGD